MMVNAVAMEISNNFIISFCSYKQGHRTGYIYHAPLVRSEPKPRSEVAYPAVSTGVTYIYDDDIDGSKYESPMKMLNRKKTTEKTKWMNTPNVYAKMEVPVEQNGEESPKTKTKVGSRAGLSSKDLQSSLVSLRHGD